MMKRDWFFLSIYFLLTSFTTELKHAEDLFQEELYADAYQAFKQLPSSGFTTARQAECLIELKQYQQAFDLLKTQLTNSEDQIQYLAAVALRHLGRYRDALTLLPIQQTAAIHLERGINQFYLQEYEEATSAFLNLLNQEDTFLKSTSYLYLARLALMNENIVQAEKYLKHIQHPLLRIEYSYIKGLIHFAKKNYMEALTHFEQALTTKPFPWQVDSLHHMALCYYYQAQLASQDPQLLLWLDKGTDCMHKVIELKPNENAYITLAQFDLLRLQFLNDQQARLRILQLIKDHKIFTSSQILFLQIAIAPTAEEREQGYIQLTDTKNSAEPWFAEAWYQRGIQQNNLIALNQAYKLWSTKNDPETLKALQAQLNILYASNTPSTLQQGWQLLNEFRIRHPQWVTASIDDLSATIGYALFEHTQDSTLLDELEQILKQSGLHTDRLRYLQCLISFQKGHVIEADQQFEQFLSQTTDENLQGEAYIWRAQCAEKLGNEVLRQHHLKQLFTQLPQHPQAPLAYLHFYPYQSYMQGERQALKHLRHLPSRFPHAPCTIFAYYLMGLEKKKNQFDSEGNLQKQHDLTTAIDYFQLAETAYDYLKSSIPLKDQRYFLHVSLRAQLERAQINLAIAHESIGTKKHIYLNYSEQVFNELLDLLKDDDWKLWEEASFGLVQVYLQQERDQQAEALLDQMLTHYKYLSISTSPFITKVWIEKGYLAHKQLQYEQALTYFRQAETVFNCSSSAEEKLEIWIEQSMCCRILNRLDEAMRLLSKVINEEIASSLRVKAMFLRAEIYEQQGRHELALKQLESVVKKGGTWAYQAQEKLKEYGYPCTSIL